MEMPGVSASEANWIIKNMWAPVTAALATGWWILFKRDERHHQECMDAIKELAKGTADRFDDRLAAVHDHDTRIALIGQSLERIAGDMEKLATLVTDVKAENHRDHAAMRAHVDAAIEAIRRDLAARKSGDPA